jgi:uncharacterized protein YoxC
MEKKTEDMNEQELLRELLCVQKKSARNNWIAMLAIVALAAAMLIGLATLLPRATRTLDAAYTTLDEGMVLLKQTEEMVDQAKHSLQEVDGMVGSVNQLIEENTDDLTEAMDKLNSIDIDKLNQSIEDLNAVIAPLAKLFGRG